MVRISLIPSVFTEVGQPGDFEWEINTQYRGKTALYIFNDNVADHCSSHPGGGNAVIRPWNRYGFGACTGKAVAAGVSTGMSARQGGFQKLTEDVRRIIDADLMEICDLLATGEYAELVYSANPGKPELLGTGIFKVCKDVKYYIVSKLCEFAVVPQANQAQPKGPAQPSSQFEKLRQRFLRQHNKAIRDALSQCFNGDVVLNVTPLKPAVQERFVKCFNKYCVRNKYGARDTSCMVPALHGTDPKNYESIFRRGLLIPGRGNNIGVAHGSCYGVGIYTAKLSNPLLSQGFCSRKPCMLVCCVIDDVECHVPADVEKGQYPLRFRNAKTRKDSTKHLFDYVEDLEVWYEWDEYKYDVWAWDEYTYDVYANVVSGKNVMHALDSMVIFDESHVLPLFIASGSSWSDPYVYDCSITDDVDLEDNESNADYVMNDRIFPRGWVARHGSKGRADARHGAKSVKRKGSHAYNCTQQIEDSRSRQKRLQHPESQESSHSCDHMHVCKVLGSKQRRVSLKRELQHDLAEERALLYFENVVA